MPKNVEHFMFPGRRMEQSRCLEVIRFSEETPQFRITVHEAKNTTTFLKESRTGMSKAAQHKEKQHWALEKPKLDSARKLRGII